MASSRSPKPQASSTVSLTGDTTNELEPLVWRIGCWLFEVVIGFNELDELIGSIIPEKGSALRWRVPFATGSFWFGEDKKSEKSSSSLKTSVFGGFCDGGGGCNKVAGGDSVRTRGPGVVGLEAGDGGGGMRKGMALDEDEDGIDAIRTIGNDDV